MGKRRKADHTPEEWEHVKAKQREYYRKNNSNKKYQQKTSRIEWTRNWRALPKTRAILIYQGAKQRATKKGLDFDLEVEWILAKLETGVCELSGMPFNFGYETSRQNPGKKNPHSPSIDRVDSTKGYTKDNCRIVLWAVNTAMSHWGLEITKEIWQRICTKPKNI